MATLTSVNPYTQEINGTFETITNDELTTIIDQAHTAYLSWRKTSLSERGGLFLRMADIIDEKYESLALLETKEMGRLYKDASKGLQGTANLIRWYAHNAEHFIGDESFAHDGMVGNYTYDPLGVIYGIAPWNFPFNQLLRAAVANIMAGNTTIYKHASNVPLCLEAIQQLFEQAGFPQGVFTKLFISAAQSEHILAHPYVQGVNLTGSEEAGSAIGSLAGKYLKPSVLELGGNDAFVLLDHEDTDAMAAAAVSCRISNGGQRCNSSKRFIVLEKYYDTFVEHMTKHMAVQQVGDPMDPSTTLPPLSSSRLVQEVHRQVQASITQGALLMTGGHILDVERNLYAPTVLAGVTLDMTSAQEEVFGPVASIIKAKDIEDAIALANDSEFGLSATVWGDNIDQCKSVARRLEGGMIFINNSAGSKSSLPFGGVKKSGYGKENGPEGLRAFTNKKAIVYSIV